MEVAAILIGAYLLGTLLPGLWIPRLYGIDIRQVGSGNVGSTNVYRALGFWPGFWVQVIDIGKAALAVWIAQRLSQEAWVWYGAATMAVVGHIFPVWAGFQGGKGVNALLGGMILIDPLTTAAAVGVFLLVLLFSRYVSLSSVTAVSSYLVWHGLLGRGNVEGYLFGVFWALLVIYTHRSNIRRLLRGEEPKVGQKKSQSAASPSKAPGAA
jgi:glycerol-3-phosphate acyltransferase PlsY